MAHLTLAGLSDDGKRLLLVSDKGVEFTLEVDDRLRAALRGDHARLGQLEIKMDSALRPRDIQARIRAGETPEAVAQAARTTVDKIMPFAAPVMAERQHVAERAQGSSVRRTGQSSGARTLGDAVAAHLRAANVDPKTVEWDAARREDGRWALTGEFSTDTRSGVARFTFDAPGNYVVAENDDAGWLLGDQRPAATEAPAADNDLSRARARRLSAVGEEELPLGDDAISLVTGEEHQAIGAEQPLEAFLEDDRPTAETPAVPPVDDSAVAAGGVVARADGAEQADSDTAGDPAPEPEREKPTRKRGRASVPSWDEIMFGGKSE